MCSHAYDRGRSEIRVINILNKHTEQLHSVVANPNINDFRHLRYRFPRYDFKRIDLVVRTVCKNVYENACIANKLVRERNKMFTYTSRLAQQT